MRRTTRLLAIILMVTLCLAAFSGCGAPEQEETPPGTGEEVVDDSKDTIILVADRETATLDPQAFVVGPYAQVVLYEGLLQMNPDGTISPCLAKEWERVDDTTWRFYLRDDVYFHNGEHMTASDVIFSFRRSQENPQAASTINFLDIDNCTADDDYTVTIKTKEPYALFETMMTDLYLSIVSEKAVNEAGSAEAFGRNPVGTGPYKFVSWTPGSEIRLTRHDQYWGEPAKVKNYNVRVITESTSRAIALEAGDVDIACRIATEDVPRIRDGEETDILLFTSAGARYVALNCKHEPLDNPKVRLALRYATNVNELADVVYGVGMSLYSAGTMIPPGMLGHNPDIEPYEYNPEKAKQLLAEAGYPNGFDLEFVYNGNSNENNTFVQLLKEYWAKAGVNLVLSPTDSAKLNTYLNEGSYDVSLCNASTNPAEAGYMLGYYYSTAKHGSGNRTWISDERLDNLISQLESTSDPEERQSIEYEIQAIADELADRIIVHYPYNNIGYRSNVRGLEASPAKQYPNVAKCYFVK